MKVGKTVNFNAKKMKNTSYFIISYYHKKIEKNCSQINCSLMIFKTTK